MQRKAKGVVALFLILCIIGVSVWGIEYFRIHEEPSELLSISKSDYPSVPSGDGWVSIEPGVIPITNPLKGFVPFDDSNLDFPHSMEYSYFPVNEIVNEKDTAFNFSIIEKKLDAVAARGHQMIFRLYFDYPNVKSGVPQYLIDDGLLLRKYSEYGGGYSPDYDDPRMVDLMVSLIVALGDEYDGDPRIGFIKVGLLGFWGEWHTYPHESWFANSSTQHTVLNAFALSFETTKLLVRYADEITVQYDVGFHDDSFGHSTLGDEDWFFYNQLVTADAIDRWKSNPIGGEVRPEIQEKIFQNKPLKGQDFEKCVLTTHASWMLNHRIFYPDEFGFTNADIQRAKIASQQLGYTFGVCYAKTANNVDPLNNSQSFVNFSLVIKNFGVAPFYYQWFFEFGLLDQNGNILKNFISNFSVLGLLPQESLVINDSLSEIPNGWLDSSLNVTLVVRIPNEMGKGSPILFANRDDEAMGGCR